ncbi:TonB-dependent siderophore receptor [Bosea lathyri]|uniref:Iron complex outermembrane recepter protein n=1 Tax=Bosea lathyri TaxID=1036778 RepID=A0A1H5ZIP9_9HYPH|nr:TonB-dependent siderophore receptor [Bosea lathyri]SEG36111.1 iron complex outermembrane recepter protein [Bosea lathyri]
MRNLLLSETALTRWLGAIASLAFASGPVQAQTAEPIDLPAIVVQGETATSPVRGYIASRSATATKTDTPIIETPQSVSVVTRDQIEAQGARGVGEALRYTAGVVPEWRGVAAGNFGAAIGSVMIRGYGVDGYWDGLKIPAIGTYGAPAPDLYLMDRIDVLKGPSSVLFGQATPGGALNLVSKRPTAEKLREVTASIDSNGRALAGFDIGGPVDPQGQWSYRVTGLGVTGETQVDHTREGRFAIAPSITWRPTSDTRLTVLGSYQHDPEIGFYDALPAIGTAVRNPLGRIPKGFYAGEPSFDRFDRKYASLAYLFEHRFNEVLTIRQNLRYVRSEFSWDAVQLSALAANRRTVNRYALMSRAEGYGLSLDNQAELNFDTGPLKHKLLMGVDYLRSDFTNSMATGMAGPIDLFAPVYGTGAIRFPAVPQTNTSQISEQFGFYAQDQIRLGKLIGLFGGRFDRAESDTLNRNTSVTTRQSDHASTGRAGLLYLFDNGLAPYVSYSESFQPTSGTDFFGAPFKPRTGQQWEAGLKYQPAGFRGLFTLAAFDITEQNRTTPDLAHTCGATGNARGCGNFNIQIGEAHSRGVEAEAKVEITPELNLIAAYTYLDARIRRSDGGDLGMRLTNSPRHSASAWLDYTFRSGPLTGLGLGAGVRHVGASPSNTLNTLNYFEAPAATLVDAALRYDFGASMPQLAGLQLKVNVQNLLDKTYAASCGGTSLDAGYCFGGQRRTVTASLTYRW